MLDFNLIGSRVKELLCPKIAILIAVTDEKLKSRKLIHADPDQDPTK